VITTSLLRAELLRIAGRFKDSEDRAFRACVAEDAGERDAAEAERQEAAGDFWAAGRDLGELLLLLLRQASDHYPDAVRDYLLDLLKPELQSLARAVARLEARQ
jgi:hypothetical protein